MNSKVQWWACSQGWACRVQAEGGKGWDCKVLRWPDRGECVWDGRGVCGGGRGLL